MGFSEGYEDGNLEGVEVGRCVGLEEGRCEGATEVGDRVVGEVEVGRELGLNVVDGRLEGLGVGYADGLCVGKTEGCFDGLTVLLGLFVGKDEGESVEEGADVATVGTNPGSEGVLKAATL